MKKLTVLSIVAVLLLLAPIVTTAEDAPRACGGLTRALENIPPDSPGYAKVLEMAQANECGEAIDHAALVALYNSTNGDGWANTIAGNEVWNEDSHHCDWYGVSCLEGRVFYIGLNNNNLNGTIPPTVGSMSSLIYLYLNHNPGLTGPIPAELSYLSNLRYLALQHTGLAGTIPDELSNLTSILGINLSYTNLGCWETYDGWYWANNTLGQYYPPPTNCY